jgi:hypothetical protein
MTIRPLHFGPPPGEHWVIVGYREVDAKGEPTGAPHDECIDWRIVQPAQMPGARRSDVEP